MSTNVNMDTPRTGIPSERYKANWNSIFGTQKVTPAAVEPTLDELKQRIASLEAEIESLLRNV